MQELGLLCLRIEAISSGRVFKPTPERKGSIQSGNDIDRNVVAHTFIGDPTVLLPPINDTSSDSDLMLLLDSLTLRIENAVNTLYMKLQNCGVIPSSRSSQPAQIIPPTAGGSTNASTLVDALMEEGALDESILKYISSVLRRL
jgi:adenylate cyclase